MSDEEEAPKRKVIKMQKKAERVRNKAPAELQITAEQLLREAKERELKGPPPPTHRISDPEELAEFQRQKRKEFEDGIRKNKHQVANWVKYGKWEESIGELQRSRSIFERALDVDYRQLSVWLQYAEMEMRNKQINHARNIFDRAVTILPRATQFWLKYAYMEEVIENIPGARQVFERWMEWEPNEQAWQTYINFELRYKEIDRARKIYQRFLHVHGTNPRHWIKYAKFEEKVGTFSNARTAYEKGMEYFGEDHLSEELLVAFAQFEERQKEHDRARVIYKYGLDHLPESKTIDLFKCYTIHEKKYGERATIEDVIISKRKLQYEKVVEENPCNYDSWFDYIRMIENDEAPKEEVEELYERAIANIPPLKEKRLWRRYIYFWINYALYEELTVQDIQKTREIYETCLRLIPNKLFTFSKVWIMYAQFELRQHNLQGARKIFGFAIGRYPKEKLFKTYIDLELQLREFDRCRILYEKFLEFAPEISQTWIKFAEMEALLGDNDRARAIYELAIKQPAFDMPELLWKSYIDFEIDAEEYDNARYLFEVLLSRTNHVKVWLSFADFEKTLENWKGTRAVYERAFKALGEGSSTERVMLLEAWLESEKQFGAEEDIKRVEQLFPSKVKRRRQILTAGGVDAGWEEYYDLIFPSDQSAKGASKLLAAAQKWKQKMEEQAKNDGQNAEHSDGDADIPDSKMDHTETRNPDSDTDISSSTESSSSSGSDSEESESE